MHFLLNACLANMEKNQLELELAKIGHINNTQPEVFVCIKPQERLKITVRHSENYNFTMINRSGLDSGYQKKNKYFVTNILVE